MLTTCCRQGIPNEADFHRKNEQDDVRQVAERYIGKSDPFIVMVSTPNAPGGIMERIEKEPVESCIYKKVFLHDDCQLSLIRVYSMIFTLFAVGT